MAKRRYGRTAVLLVLYLNAASAGFCAVAGLMTGRHLQWVIAMSCSIVMLLVASWVHTGRKPWQKERR